MRRTLVITCVLTMSLVAAPAVLATTQMAHAGNVTATFTFQGKYPNYSGEAITIAQAGTVFYEQPVVSKFCETECAPGSPFGKPSSVHMVDLEHNGQPDVVLDLFSGGAHCCSIEQIFSFDPGTMTYVETERDFGDRRPRCRRRPQPTRGGLCGGSVMRPGWMDWGASIDEARASAMRG